MNRDTDEQNREKLQGREMNVAEAGRSEIDERKADRSEIHLARRVEPRQRAEK
jgi:hypothetical protein